MNNSTPKPLSWPAIVGLSMTGLAVGLLTSLVGLPQFVELGVWLTAYVGWGFLVLRRKLPAFVTPLAASVLSGVWTGGTQYLLREQYVANNPWYAEEIAEAGGITLAGVLGFALVMGLAWGLVLGGVFRGIAALQNRRAS